MFYIGKVTSESMAKCLLILAQNLVPEPEDFCKIYSIFMEAILFGEKLTVRQEIIKVCKMHGIKDILLDLAQSRGMMN